MSEPSFIDAETTQALGELEAERWADLLHRLGEEENSDG